MKSSAIISFIIILSIGCRTAYAESVYDRVMRTGEIRCGYLLWPPFFDRDLNTGKFSGMNYDYVESIGRSLGVKIEWALAVSPGDQVEALRSGKIDAMCAGDGPLIPSTLKYLSYSEPLAYIPFFLYARSDDKRFDLNWKEVINQSWVRISTIDGDASGQTARIFFPKAKHITIPQIAYPNQMMMDVETKKADILINDPLTMSVYFEQNPDYLKRIDTKGPVAVIPNTLSVLKSEDTILFISMLDQAIENLKNSGLEKKILEPYAILKNGEESFYMSPKSYQDPSR